MKFRTGRIWRLGEQEVVVRRYYPPKRIELRGAREDDVAVDKPLADRRLVLGLHAEQLTHEVWHRIFRSRLWMEGDSFETP